jgi:hypothetical protein
VDLLQRSGCLEEENAKTQRCKDAKDRGSRAEIRLFGLRAIRTLGGTVKFRCDELPPNDASMRFSSRFQGILPMSPPLARFGHVAYLL